MDKKVAAVGVVALVLGAGSAVFLAGKAKPPKALPAKVGSTVTISNTTDADTTVYFAFGADSAVLPTDWAFCHATAKLNCSFSLKKGASQALPLGGKYLNATFAFGAPVNCGSTKGELNLNNPAWFDIADVSLVDGFSNKILIEVDGVKLGPPAGAQGNEKVYGVYPMGCDICVARQKPPAGWPQERTAARAGPTSITRTCRASTKGP